MPSSSIVTVGNELLHGFTADTNSSWLAARLYRLGFPVQRIEIVGDVIADIVEAVQAQIRRSQNARIFVCGGLGPTPDDRTYAALAVALERPLAYHRPTGALMQSLMFTRGVAARRGTAELNAGNRRMATIPEGAAVLRNGPGMAPGLAFDIGPDRFLFALPGPPHELHSVFEQWIEPSYLRGGRIPVVRELHYRAAPESAFHDAMVRLERDHPTVSIGSYPHAERGELIIRIEGVDPVIVDTVVTDLQAQVDRYQPVRVS
jgi:nicotinamide-nucleotide amidase